MKKAVFIVAAAAVLAAGSMVAFANWTANGSGSGSALAMTASNVTVSAATPTACFYPGASCPVVFTLSNTNPYAITFNTLTGATNLVVTPLSGKTCSATDFSIASTPITSLNLPVAAGSSSTPTVSAPQQIANLITMNSTALDGCQGAAVTIDLTLTGNQS